MNYKREKTEGCSLVYEVSFEPTAYEIIEKQAFNEVQKEVLYPGFRKGKVPYEIIKEHFSQAVREKVEKIAIGRAVGEIIERDKIIPVVHPSVYDIKHEIPSKKLSFKIYFEISPVFEPKGYTDFEIVKRIRKITDKDVANYIEQIREQNAYLKSVDAVASADKYVVVDYEIYEDGKKVDEVRNEMVDMSSPQQIAGFEEAIVGAKKGDIKEFETNFDKRRLKFVITVKDVKEKVIPDMDDAMIKQLGAKDMDDLKNQIRVFLEDEERIKSEKDFIEQIENKLIENNQFPLPPTLLRQEMEELFEIAKKRANLPAEYKPDVKDYEDDLKPIAERNLRISYILRAISKKENIKATEDDYLREVEKMIKNLKNEIEIDKAKALFESRKGYILALITENKTMEFIKSRIKVKEEIVEY